MDKKVLTQLDPYILIFPSENITVKQIYIDSMASRQLSCRKSNEFGKK